MGEKGHTTKEAKLLRVPNYSELSVKNLYAQVLKFDSADPLVKMYL